MMPNSEPKAWNLANTVITTLGGIVAILLITGIGLMMGDRDSIKKQIADGDSVIYQELREIKQQNKETANHFLKLTEDVAILKANQQARLEREKIEAERKARNEK
jgi:hypothetical protein